jgi:hypothetical protein
MIPVMVVDVVVNIQCTMIRTLCINMAWCCGEPVSYVLRHPVMSILLHCLMPTARLFPSWRAGSPDSPGFQDGFPFPGVHTCLLHTIRYTIDVLAALVCKNQLSLVNKG